MSKKARIITGAGVGVMFGLMVLGVVTVCSAISGNAVSLDSHGLILASVFGAGIGAVLFSGESIMYVKKIAKALIWACLSGIFFAWAVVAIAGLLWMLMSVIGAVFQCSFGCSGGAVFTGWGAIIGGVFGIVIFIYAEIAD
jgi:hypothetical protein